MFGRKKIYYVFIEEVNIIIPSSHPRLALTTFINNSKLLIMNLSLKANEFSLGTLSLVDADSGATIPATFSNQSYTASDGSFTAIVDGSNPNVVRVEGVSEGSGTLTASADASYTDGNTGQSVTVTLSLVVDVQITAVAQGQNVNLSLTFSPAQPK